MALAAGLGVHVGGRVDGEEVDKGWALAVGLLQAGNNVISNAAINKFFLLIEWRVLQVLRLMIWSVQNDYSISIESPCMQARGRG